MTKTTLYQHVYVVLTYNLLPHVLHHVVNVHLGDIYNYIMYLVSMVIFMDYIKYFAQL